MILLLKKFGGSMQIVVCHEKYGPIYYVVKNETDLPKICKGILKNRLNEGWYDNNLKFKQAVELIVKPKSKGLRPSELRKRMFYQLLLQRRDHEYERVELVETLDPGE
jgi:hypothetical protein